LLPPQINLPTHAVIYESKLDQAKAMTDDEIIEVLRKEKADQIINDKETLVIINDHHRSTPSHRILKCLWKISPNNNIDCIAIATGSHRPPNAASLGKLLGGLQNKLNCKIEVHDSTAENLVYVGTTSRNTDVNVNPILLEYDQILVINSVEPHYFAGFTGGIKSVIPGLAAISTIEQNHSWALHDAIGPTVIDTNPLQQDLWEAGNFINATMFGIQMVSVQDKIFSIFIGDLEVTYQEAVTRSKQTYTQKLDTAVDIVLSVIYPPLNKTLYQAQKGIENTRQVLKPGGEMILLASCEEGIGNSAFYDTLSQFETVEDVIHKLKQKNYSFGDHKAQKFATLAKDCTLTLATELADSICKQVFANRVDPKHLELYLHKLSQEGKSIAVVLDSGSLVLHL
jgi:nickel-dependent lactate racemase